MEREPPITADDESVNSPRLARRVSLPGMTEPSVSSSSEAEAKARNEAARHQTRLAEEEAKKREREEQEARHDRHPEEDSQ
ncbi:MAG: hypothetical protein KDA55_13350 [Planctomycetales bacterium]|nr:hypothetical protein [Planctomycetales bacterium]